jgi:hypothetical protein
MRDLCRPSTVSILDNFSALYGRSSIGSQLFDIGRGLCDWLLHLVLESFRGITRAQEYAMLRHGARGAGHGATSLCVLRTAEREQLAAIAADRVSTLNDSRSP